jgi:acyl transferase domain-containing protein
VKNPLVISAAKFCVGHAETVSGLIGVIKTIGSFAAGTVPGLVQLTPDNMNPSIDYSSFRYTSPPKLVLNRLKDGPLRAMILT